MSTFNVVSTCMSGHMTESFQSEFSESSGLFLFSIGIVICLHTSDSPCKNLNKLIKPYRNIVTYVRLLD